MSKVTKNSLLSIFKKYHLKNKESINLVNDRIDNLPITSNPNLLINGDFQVWQRGDNFKVESFKYGCDRWLHYYDANISKTNNGLYYRREASINTVNPYLRQSLIMTNTMLNRDFVFTVKISNLNVTNGMYLLVKNRTTNTNLVTQYSFSVDGIHSVIGKFLGSVGDIIDCYIAVYNTTDVISFNVEWVKLELGSVATPFVPKTYAEELRDCQRYYQRWTQKSDNQDIGLSSSYMATPNSAYPIIPLTTEMRVSPTIKCSNISDLEFYCINSANGSYEHISLLSLSTYLFGKDRLTVYTEINSASTVGSGCSLQLKRGIGKWFELDAEIY